MVHGAESGDTFASMVLAGVKEPSPDPEAFYNEDGDCIEFLISTDSYYAERVDDLLTVYRSQVSGEIVGSLIKGVSKFLRNALQTHPGFAIEVQDGDVCLTHLFSLGMWQAGDNVRVQTYKCLRDTADEHHISVSGLPEFA